MNQSLGSLVLILLVCLPTVRAEETIVKIDGRIIKLPAPSNPYRDDAIDDLAIELLNRMQAEPADCSEYLEAQTMQSIIHCGKVETINPKDPTAWERAIDTTMLEFDASPLTEWRTRGKRNDREYDYDKVRVNVHFNTRFRFVIFTYPPQPRDCPIADGVRPGDAEGIVGAVLLDEAYVPPRYPELARVARFKGIVYLQVVVQRDGSVSDPCTLLGTPPNLGFEESALEAVSQWRYQPATLDGEPIDVYLTLEIGFDLD